MFNYKLAREIYGASPWHVDPISMSSLLNILQDFRAGVSFEQNEEQKLNSMGYVSPKNLSVIQYDWQLRNLAEGEQAVGIIHLNGPITKNGGASSYGMKQISSNMMKLSADERIVGHVLLTDSGGGSANAIPFMEDAIKDSQSKGKPVVQLIEKGGLSASAAYYIGSYCDYILSEAADNMVGSIGTMIEFAGYPKRVDRTNYDGAVIVRAYATASVNKNVEFEQALEGNLEPITSKILDPHQKKFADDVKQNRPNVKEEQLDGSIFYASEVVGTLIDGIGNMESAVNKVLELSKSKAPNKNNARREHTNSNLLNKNSQKMDLTQLKQEHPDVYKAAFNEGVSAEQDRAGAWLAHADADLEEVKAGIKSGKNISQTQTQELIIKANRTAILDAKQEDSAEATTTNESTTENAEEEIEEKEVQDFYAQVDNKMQKK